MSSAVCVSWPTQVPLVYEFHCAAATITPSVDGTLVETEPWPGLTSRVLVLMSQLFSHDVTGAQATAVGLR